MAYKEEGISSVYFEIPHCDVIHLPAVQNAFDTISQRIENDLEIDLRYI